MDMLDSPLEHNSQDLTWMKRQPPVSTFFSSSLLLPIFGSSCLSSLFSLLMFKTVGAHACAYRFMQQISHMNVHLVLKNEKINKMTYCKPQKNISPSLQFLSPNIILPLPPPFFFFFLFLKVTPLCAKVTVTANPQYYNDYYNYYCFHLLCCIGLPKF